METEPLAALSEQSARVGTWRLAVVSEPKAETYTWSKGAGGGEGKKFQVRLVSEESTVYCVGIFRRRGKEPAASKAFDEAKDKFTKGSVWNVNKLTLVKTERKYLGCSHKVVIDLNMSRFEPIFAGFEKMPKQATPPDDLHALLECKAGQVVDIIYCFCYSLECKIAEINSFRQTRLG